MVNQNLIYRTPLCISGESKCKIGFSFIINTERGADFVMKSAFFIFIMCYIIYMR